MRRFHFVPFVVALVLFATQSLMAATYYVGSCRTGSNVYGTIQAAVNAAAPGSTVEVCPGSYPEQVVISQPLTLKGLIYNDSSLAVVALPSAGLATTSSITVGTTAAQVQVTAGPVNITNITVDGTAGEANCPSVPYFGIFYSSGSSGTVNDIEVRNQNCGDGNGILVENGAGAVQAVTIENSNINNYNNVGVWGESNQSPTTLNASIKNNYITTGTTGISTYFNLGGSVTDNLIVDNSQGMFLGSASCSPVSGNTVVGGNVGMLVGASVSITSNKISNTAQKSINLDVGNVTVKSNTVVNQTGVGIEFNCNTGTVTANTINGGATGLDEAPAGFSGVNNSYNLTTDATGGCGGSWAPGRK